MSFVFFRGSEDIDGAAGLHRNKNRIVDVSNKFRAVTFSHSRCLWDRGRDHRSAVPYVFLSTAAKFLACIRGTDINLMPAMRQRWRLLSETLSRLHLPDFPERRCGCVCCPSWNLGSTLPVFPCSRSPIVDTVTVDNFFMCSICVEVCVTWGIDWGPASNKEKSRS